MAKEVAIRVSTILTVSAEVDAQPELVLLLELLRPTLQAVRVPGRQIRALHAALAAVIQRHPTLCGPEQCDGLQSYEFRLPGNAAEKAGDN